MRPVAIAALLLLPFPLIAVAGGAIADHVGKKLGATAAALGAQLGSRQDSHPTTVLLSAAEPNAALATTVEKPSARTGRKPIARSRALETPDKGVFVRAQTVLRLANSGSRPSGAFVAAEGARPAGIALVGVSGLGIGLIDGDILTHAGGRPARSAADVVGTVIASRGAHASQISGRFWRAGEYYNLVVEQPYLGGEAPVAHCSVRPQSGG